ncbi:beta-N-acetylhexosaminidase [Tropicimonas marinistellae]|uniref:beta-N-acetylhexosaminidase n=1 Tax=Tropicimonas marinistellae TaxID=1739787 RepID=UPI00082DE201|nr:family 20 glycosylhydrolase [Tropicimonas marinistellae]
MSQYRLEARFNGAKTREDTRLDFALHNLSHEPLTGARLGYSSLTRVSDHATVSGADLVRRFANYHEWAMPDGLSVPPSGTWEFAYTGTELHVPKHRTDGPISAVLLRGEEALPVEVGDLACDGGDDSGSRKSVPEGKLDQPILLQPWPAEIAIDAYGPDGRICPAPGSDLDNISALATVAALHGRLFPDHACPLALSDGAAQLAFASNTILAPEEFTLQFDGPEITLAYGDEAGRFYGLVALAQMAHGALSAPETFRFPTRGRIADAPRFAHRGAMLDVSRHFWSLGKVRRFLDTMAWARLNTFQWHLTDDEGWRIEIDAFPELTAAGAVRGPSSELVGQLGYNSQTYGGFYTKAQIRELVAHAALHHVAVIPEIDIPGHCTAVLTALPHLVDPDEKADSYRSVQGYPNNALNPGIPETYDFIDKVMAEVADLFPASWVHVGADEVPDGAWIESPRAMVLAQSEGLSGTAEMQSYFLRRVQQILRSHGKELAGWDEVSHGGGVDQKGTLLVAWQRPELVRGLAEMGYRVVASPGQAYYMDMVQADGWEEPGASWAGTSTPKGTYSFDPEGGLDENERGALAGVQACIWCEYILNPRIFNHMVYPRLYAVAEAGWTPQATRDWQRFAAICHHMPEL